MDANQASISSNLQIVFNYVRLKKSWQITEIPPLPLVSPTIYGLYNSVLAHLLLLYIYHMSS